MGSSSYLLTSPDFPVSRVYVIFFFFHNAYNINTVSIIIDIVSITVLSIPISTQIFTKIKESGNLVRLAGLVIDSLETEYLWCHLGIIVVNKLNSLWTWMYVRVTLGTSGIK